MPDSAKKQTIKQRVRQTFALLREMLLETPLKPVNTPVSHAPAPFQIYLDDLIAAHELLRMPGFGVDGTPAQVALDEFYFPLGVIDKRLGKISPESDDGFYGGAGILTLTGILQRYQHLVLTGGPGSGKTTLLAYLAISYARSYRVKSAAPASRKHSASILKNRLFPDLGDALPILLRLSDLGSSLKSTHTQADSPALLIDYLRTSHAGRKLALPTDFFDYVLISGQAVLLLDGLDEVADPFLRQRVTNLIQMAAELYPACRMIITCRNLDDQRAALAGPQFGLAQVCPLSPAEARQFLSIASLATAETPLARDWAENLVSALDENPRLAGLPITPLLLSFSALVFRAHRHLPARSARLLASAVQLWLGHHGTGQGSAHQIPFDEQRRLLGKIALWLQSHQQLTLTYADFRALVFPEILELTSGDPAHANQILADFLLWIEHRGIFNDLGAGTYAFAQRSLQEYLAASALALQVEDEIGARRPEGWWREVLLFESGFPKHGVEVIDSLLKANVDNGPYSDQALLLASECFFMLGASSLPAGVRTELITRLKKMANSPVLLLDDGGRQLLQRKYAAHLALARLGRPSLIKRFWKLPFGEPDWVTIPAGEFWMGETHQLRRQFLPEFQIARGLVTNAQYAIYLASSAAPKPEYWRAGQIPAGIENHPVVNVSWYEALAYCAWLGQKIGKPVCLPSEAEWEKAARGDQDQREYPWGAWADLCANTSELGLGGTSPVGLFPLGASPFGLLDMLGNVREWTRSLYLPDYPDGYDPADVSQENLQAGDDQPRVLRGGSFYYHRAAARCAYRQRYYPDFKFDNFGFRVAISSAQVWEDIKKSG